MPLFETCIHDSHVKLGAKMVDFAGWHMPIQYTSIVSEHNLVRERVGIFDVSHMGQIFVSGKEASDFLSYVTTWEMNRLSKGDCRYCHILNENGQIIDDTIVYTFSSENFMLVPNASMVTKIFEWLNSNSSDFDVLIENKSDDFFCFAVQGPEAPRLLRQFFNLAINPFKLVKSGNMIISGTGYTGEKGYEIMGPLSESLEIWQSFLDMGAIPIGLGARDTLRLEKGYLLSGTDFDGNQTTLESGYSWVIDWNHDFIGKDKLLVQKEKGYKLLKGILLEERGVLRSGLPVYYDEKEISKLTSGSLSPILKRGIGLSYVDLPVGTTVNIMIRNKQLKGRVIQTPFL
ncbi:MAG: glycine cleavage system aminomethyltransferase GcvT [Candidatus Thermoplasmatota archaeon]|nr:glycine cleavage system aminomethyltransferase GcvT [Candidatus Thermoplasmatota archaeon]